jgi:hypothetical protein
MIVSATVYWPGLSGPLVLDDLPQLSGLIEQHTDDPAVLFNNYIISTSGPLGRPVSMATFIFDAVLHGADVWWWKLSNLFLHLVCGFMVYWLVVLLLSAQYRADSKTLKLAGLAVAAIWLLHPLQVSTVLYTVQRMTELSTLFVFAGLVAYTKGRLLQEHSLAKGWALIGLAFCVFFPLATFSKESGLLFPVYCTLIELAVFKLQGVELVKKSLRIAHGILLLTYVAAAAVVLSNFSEIVLSGYSYRDFTLGERLLTQFRVITTYLSQLALPIQSRMGFFHDDLIISTGFFQPISTFFSALFICCILGTAVYAWRRLPLYSFGILFFFASHALESTIFGLELMFEHRNYTGSFGIFLAICALATKVTVSKKVLRSATILGICLLALITWQRSATWSTAATLYENMYRAHPDSPRLNSFFANLYASIGDYDAARKHVAKIADIPGSGLHVLLIQCLEHRSVSESELSSASRFDDIVVESYVTSTVNSIVELIKTRRCKVPLRSFANTLDNLLLVRARSPIDRQTIYFSKATVLEVSGDVDAAIETYLKAQESLQTSALPLYLAADLLARNLRLKEARRMLTRAGDLEKRSRIVKKNLATTIYAGIAEYYEEKGQVDDAVATYEEAFIAVPGNSLVLLKAADILLGNKRYEDAEKMLQRFNKLGGPDSKEIAQELERINRIIETRKAEYT